MRRGRLVGLLSLALASTAAGQGPSADWQTIETRHFRIHHPAPFDAFAHHVAGSIEGSYTGVTDPVGYEPGREIDVVVCDPDADFNGMAIPYLDRPEIILWTSPPGAETG